jgi:hypothetical protein
MNTPSKIIALTTLILSPLANASGWDGANDPSIFSSNFEYRLAQLPLKATLPAEKMPWSETYWPAQKGSINYRWNSPSPEGFGNENPTRDQLMHMSHDQLAQLSPSEKYDVAMGRYSFPLKKEVASGSSPRAKDWAGICNGWAPAALEFREPKPVEVTNPDGIVVPFGSSDVKGLLSYHLAFEADLDVAQVGKRCFKMTRFLGASACDDINPGAMHVILANQLGILHEGFVGEIDRTHEVWNQPIYGFESEIVGSAQSRHAAQAVRVRTKIYYTDELETSNWEPVNGTDKFKFDHQDVEYILELDSTGRITGGQWITQDVHPDFFWKANKKPIFDGDFKGLNKIYQPSI